MKKVSIDEKCINTIRCLAMDAVQKANSGHPGTPMALAPAAYSLWTEHLRYNPTNPLWFNRDRFVLSCGHASMLQYAILHLTGYAISIEDIKNFRQLDSITPGHPEHGITPGIETTTGPLGQGIMNAVGMAIAEAHLAAIFNKPDHKIVDHHTYTFCSDGDLMEGASNEAASVAGHLGLGKLICLYDDNHISIEGNTSLTYSDDVTKRFESYHWHVQNLGDLGNDLQAISDAFKNAKEVKDKPSLIILRTHIGYGSPNKQDTAKAHGSPLGEDEIKLTKKFYGWPENEKFLVPGDVKKQILKAVPAGNKMENEWNKALANYQKKYPELHAQFKQYLKQYLPKGWDNEIPIYKASDGAKATRSVSADVINAVAPHLPWLIGGSGDLEPSTETMIKSSGYFAKERYEDRNMAWGVREHNMVAASSGMMLHGGLRPYAATFFVFTDYCRPAIRLACIMKLPVIYVMTHDSIGLGEDGTTHQPIEHLASLRAMPNMHIIRPADANEATYAWREAIHRTDGPTILVLTRQKLPVFDTAKVASAQHLAKGAYVLSPSKKKKADIILLATGSEVHLILEAQQRLEKAGISASVVSFPSWELFRLQSPKYRDSVLPKDIKMRLAIEAGASQGWHEWVGDSGKIIAIDKFGSSAPDKDLFKHYGFTVENVVNTAKKMLKRKS
ncbi:MAG: tkt [Bacteroidota bacterium]|nr:tkt [Bacteroidota bacterium]